MTPSDIRLLLPDADWTVGNGSGPERGVYLSEMDGLNSLYLTKRDAEELCRFLIAWLVEKR